MRDADLEKEIKNEQLPIFHFSNILIGLLKLWWLFLIVGIAAGLLGIFYASSQKPIYKSRLTFALDDGDNAGIGNFLNLASQFGINIGSGKDIFAGDNILEIMKSRRMVESVLLSTDTFENRPYTMIEYYLEKSREGTKPGKIEPIHFPVSHLLWLSAEISYQD